VIVLTGLKTLLAALFIVFLPGSAWSAVLFPKKDMDRLERIALSFALSVALVPLTVFWLNWLFGVRITLLSTSLAVCGLVALPLS
jgi:uncharacterized membrane protein